MLTNNAAGGKSEAKSSQRKRGSGRRNKNGRAEALPFQMR